MQNQEINIVAVLAAILFNINKTHDVVIKTDDTQEESTQKARVVGLKIKDDALVCAFPVSKLMYFMNQPHTFKLTINNGNVVLMFDKPSETPQILSANGTPVEHQSAAIQEILNTFNQP